MTRDGAFAAATVALTLIVPGLLLLLAPFGETRPLLAVGAGWGLALLIMVPSYVLLSRVISANNRNRFLGGFLGGTLGRMVLTIVGILVFWKLVDDAPLKLFLLTFFLGYFLLTGAELLMMLGRLPNRGGDATGPDDPARLADQRGAA